MDETKRRLYLSAMGITVWEARSGAVATPPAAEALGPEVPAAEPDSPASEPQLAWAELERQVLACTRCGLAAGRTQAVFGVGAQDAQWMFIGEGPGADEDRQGEPFVGRAGRLLNEMLHAIGLLRADVYIANIVKCRPPGNREPLPEEAAACEPYLRRQIDLVNPRLLVALGRVAAQNLLGTQANLGALRGKVLHYGVQRTPVVVTYHPAYLLRNPLDKRKAWQDLLFARRVVEQGG